MERAVRLLKNQISETIRVGPLGPARWAAAAALGVRRGLLERRVVGPGSAPWEADGFLSRWADDYRRAFPPALCRRPSFFLTAGGARHAAGS